jgi:signal transduction histidine kinase
MTAQPAASPDGQPQAESAPSAPPDPPAVAAAAAQHVRRSVNESPSPRRRVFIEDPASRWPLGRIITAGVATLFVLFAATIVVGALAIANLDSTRNQVVNVIEPAELHGSQLYTAMLNQETGLRGYLLSAQPQFLQPYAAGRDQEQAQLTALRPLLAGFGGARADLATAVRRIEHWRSSYAASAIARVRVTGKPQSGGSIGVGKADFDSVRAPLGAFQRALASQRALTVARLATESDALDETAIAGAVVLLLGLIALGVALRSAAIRPLARLAGDARQVAGGDLEHEVDPSGPREVHTLATDVNRMRERVLRELSAVRAANIALQARALDLERSNSELEQFAYVASHDLQEPLRKVASFCQLLQRRYIGQLDARADQYIEFAVDGAKRMQALIDDLLAFSRVGRFDREPVLVSCASALSEARVNLANEIRSTKAVIETTDLPAVQAEFSLLTSLFQNLLGNALKFRSEQPPLVRVSAIRHDETFWLFSVADNGIGIEPEYAERIFVIFQRLHSRSDYEGTGIGLAMCRKIVEHYGGRIWLDTGYQDGANFCFTLPVAPIDEEEPSR